jgi:hypothetical protein
MLSCLVRLKQIIVFTMFFSLVVVSACTHSIHQQYIGSMDPNATYSQGRWVTADASDLVILSFQFDTKYVQAAMRDLESKCSGRIAQVTTEHLTSFKFLSYEQKVIMKGWCTEKGKSDA